MDPVQYDEGLVQRGLAFARIVAVVFMLCAILNAASVAQTVLMAWNQSASVVCGELTFGGLAVAQVAVGSRIYDGSFAATVLGVLVSGFGALFATGWFFYLLFWGGVLAVLPGFVAAGSTFGALTSLILLPVARQIEQQRRQLLEGL